MNTNELLALIGYDHDSDNVQTFLNQNRPFEDFLSETDIYKISYKLGLDLLFRENKLDSIFLYSEGRDGHEEYCGEVPLNMKFNSNRKELVSTNKPERTWKIGQGEVDVSFSEPSHDRWVFGTYTISAHYGKKTGAIMYFIIRKNA